VRELVRRADDEALESVLRVERRRLAIGGGGRLGKRARLRAVLEHNLDRGAAQLRKRLRQDALVVLRQPVLELCVRHSHAQPPVLQGQERGGPEPGGEAVTVDLRLDLGEHLVPEVHGRAPGGDPGRERLFGWIVKLPLKQLIIMIL
jgi:hypothetical protein